MNLPGRIACGIWTPLGISNFLLKLTALFAHFAHPLCCNFWHFLYIVSLGIGYDTFHATNEVTVHALLGSSQPCSILHKVSIGHPLL